MVTRLGGTILPNVQSERESRDSGMFTQALPTLDSSDTVLLDLFGVTKTISVEGFVIGSEADLKTFINAIEALQAPIQTGSEYYSELLAVPIDVYIQNFEWTWAAGDPTKIQYSITCIEGVGVS